MSRLPIQRAKATTYSTRAFPRPEPRLETDSICFGQQQGVVICAMPITTLHNRHSRRRHDREHVFAFLDIVGRFFVARITHRSAPSPLQHVCRHFTQIFSEPFLAKSHHAGSSFDHKNLGWIMDIVARIWSLDKSSFRVTPDSNGVFSQHVKRELGTREKLPGFLA